MNDYRKIALSKKDRYIANRPEVYISDPNLIIKNEVSKETKTSKANKQFFKKVFDNAHIWIVVNKNISQDSEQYQRIKTAYESNKGFKKNNKFPLCRTLKECQQWVQKFPCQIIIDENIFQQVFDQINKQDKAQVFYIVSPSAKQQLYKKCYQNSKIKMVYEDYDQILTKFVENMQKIAIYDENQNTQSKNSKGKSVRNVRFPNFIKMSKNNKQEYIEYRLNLKGLRTLQKDKQLDSKMQFLQLCRQKFPQDQEQIDIYQNGGYNAPREILQLYAKECFFCKFLNNSLRMAKTSSSSLFHLIGQPFNRVFSAIKANYKPQQLILYRGVDLKDTQCKHLKENVGKYIEINGFISTSKDQKVAVDFAKSRNHNKIFQIRIKKVSESSKYIKYDYGFVDFQFYKCSEFNEKEVLINAMNIFKIIGTEQKNGLEVFILEYGNIFDILETQNPKQLNEDDSYAYYSFIELMQENEHISDVGDVFLKTGQPGKAVQYYMQKLQSTTSTQEESFAIKEKLAQSFIANNDPKQALKMYSQIRKTNNKQLSQSLSQIHSQSQILNFRRCNSQTFKNVPTQKLVQISTNISSIHTSLDQYQDSQSTMKSAKTKLEEDLQKKFSISLFESKIQMQNESYKSKMKQDRFQEAFDILQEIQNEINEVLSNNDSKKMRLQPYSIKKLCFQQTSVYQRQSQILNKIENKYIKVSEIYKSFSTVYKRLEPMIEKNPYEQGILKFRQNEIKYRTFTQKQKYDKKKALNNIEQALQQIKKAANQNDQILYQLHGNLARLKRQAIEQSSSQDFDFSEVKDSFKKKLMIETRLYGTQNPRYLQTKLNIAECQRLDKKPLSSISTCQQAQGIKVFKLKQRFSCHARIQYQMAEAYAALAILGGQEQKNFNLKVLEKLEEAQKILRGCLTQNDFKNSALGHQIKLKIGQWHLAKYFDSKQSKEKQQHLNKAQTQLKEFNEFIQKYHAKKLYGKHSDIAISKIYMGNIYQAYQNKQKIKEAQQFYEDAVEILQSSKEENSIQEANARYDLAICLAQQQGLQKQANIQLENCIRIRSKYNARKGRQSDENIAKYLKAYIFFFQRKYKQSIKNCEQCEIGITLNLYRFKDSASFLKRIQLLKNECKDCIKNPKKDPKRMYFRKCNFQTSFARHK